MARFLRRGVNAGKQVEAFNLAFRVGDDVLYTPYPGAEPVRDRIYAPAEVLSGHRAVAWLAGQRGCVDVGHVRAAPKAETQHAA